MRILTLRTKLLLLLAIVLFLGFLVNVDVHRGPPPHGDPRTGEVWNATTVSLVTPREYYVGCLITPKIFNCRFVDNSWRFK